MNLTPDPLIATGWLVFTLFLVTTITAVVRWRLGRNWASLWWAVIFGYGALLYAYINSPFFDLLVARYAVRFAMAMLVIPHLLENADAIWRRLRIRRKR